MFLLSVQKCKVYYQDFDLNLQIAVHMHTLKKNRDKCLDIYDPFDNKRQYVLGHDSPQEVESNQTYKNIEYN